MAKKLILIHGLGGTADGTWGKFPDLLREDTDLDCEVISIGFESWMFKLSSLSTYLNLFKRSPSILNVANGVLTEIKAKCDILNDEIIIAGHSLGGVVLKKVMLILANKREFHKIKKICFFDVPHDGSGYANVGKYFHPWNRHLRSLTRDSSELDDLNEQWINSELNNSLQIISIIAANDKIVSSLSSKSIFREHPVETINYVDHSSIVKPQTSNDTVYIVFKNFILKKNSLEKYRNAASRIFENWMKYERNHSYKYASDNKRATDFENLKRAFELDKAVIRLTGASGLGKSRLLIEAISDSVRIDNSVVLIFDAPDYEQKLKESIRSMTDEGAFGLVIVENCSTDLHNHLAKEVDNSDCSLTLVTIGYSDEQVDDSIHIKLSPLSDEAICEVLTPILIGMSQYEVSRVAQFAQGYPLMATLIAEQYQKEGRLLGSINQSSVVRKLIDGDGGVTPEERAVLSACSLFDVFGAQDGQARAEGSFISENIAGSSLRVFDEVLKKFTSRQILSRAGRYARVVPKPLALTLASQWWEDVGFDRQKQLIDELPDTLMHSFCVQASYLDTLPSIQKFSDKLFGANSPFVQAEALLTERGSKLFRAFVEVNPESTSDAIYRILSAGNRERLMNITGEVRRNLVWGLEKLCFHEKVFDKSAWSMLLLASAENETWSNNATGMFAQLFRINLSGTQAKPKTRFDLLIRAIDHDNVHFDMVVLHALSQSINTYGGTRTVGAEYQGTKATLEEWQPKFWQEIYDFWRQAFDFMFILLKRGDPQKSKVLVEIGHSIRGLVAHGQIQMLDDAIKKIVAVNGRYWPAALESIKNSIEYDSNEMKEETRVSLSNWLELLAPSNTKLDEKLKILVCDPPWEHREDGDGNYIDVAEQNAKAFATELANRIGELTPYIAILLSGDQKQSYAFGYQLALEMVDCNCFIDASLSSLKDIHRPNYRLIMGLYRGLFEKSPEGWQKKIDQILLDRDLIFLYPDLIRTGDIGEAHLDKLLELIQNGMLPPSSVNSLSYGGVTLSIPANVIVNFCLRLSDLRQDATWPALNVIYMYYYGNKDCLNTLRDQLKKLVLAVPLSKEQRESSTDIHHWYDLAKKLLVAEDREFAVSLTYQLIAATKHGLNYSDIWNHTKPLMLTLMRDYGETLMPVLGDAIVHSEGMERYWLQELLDRGTGLADNSPSVFSVLPVESVLDWCKKFPDLGPVFISRCLDIFETDQHEQKPSKLFVAILEQFGANPKVNSELRANMSTRGWSGSLIPYLESDRKLLGTLLEHSNFNVRNWAIAQIAEIDLRILDESSNDEESKFRMHEL